MPDQVRHDEQRLRAFLNFGTVWKAGVQKEFADCGSGFPAAICIAVVKAFRGWKAAPTNIFRMPFV
jgi:hypothetical protein